MYQTIQHTDALRTFATTTAATIATLPLPSRKVFSDASLARHRRNLSRVAFRSTMYAPLIDARNVTVGHCIVRNVSILDAKDDASHTIVVRFTDSTWETLVVDGVAMQWTTLHAFDALDIAVQVAALRGMSIVLL